MHHRHRLLAGLLVLLTPAALPAAGLITGTLAGLMRGPRKALVATVRAVEVETANVTATLRLRRLRKFRLRVPAVPTLLLAEVTNARTGTGAGGVSRLLRPTDRKRVKTKVSLAPRFAPGTWNVGVPRTNFTATGPDLGPWAANGEADMVTTDLVNSPCYGDGRRFVITETDPRIVEACQREIELSNSEYGDPSTRLVDRRVPPDKLVSGSVVSNGTSITVALVLQDAGGNTLASGSATGPADQWFETHEKAVKALANEICDEKGVRITEASCPATACACCDKPAAYCQGVFWTERMRGTATGPVGATLQVNFPTTLGGQLSCPGWTPATCLADLACCQRMAAEQPETIDFEAWIDLPPFRSCACPRPDASEVGVVAQVVTETSADEDSRDVACPGN